MAVHRGRSTGTLDGEVAVTTDSSPSLRPFLIAVVMCLLRLVAAAALAALVAGGVCAYSLHFQLRSADFTCGHNLPIPWIVLFFLLWPIFEFVAPALWRRRSRNS